MLYRRIRGSRLRLPWLLAAGALAMLLASACGGSEPPSYAATVIDPPAPVPDLSLIDHDGRPFTLGDLRGEVVVVYVGYTHCPDVCPTTLLSLASARKALPEDVRDDIRVVMVTADPDRDTPDILKRYVGYFDPTFIGVTGSHDEVLEALGGWGIEPVCGTPDENGNYAVTHPAVSFVLDREGRMRLRASHDLTQDIEVFANDLELVWREGN